MKNSWVRSALTMVSVGVLLGGMATSGVANEAPAPSAAPVGDAKAGEAKANGVCLACHGPQGNAIVPIWPKLAGQHPEYIYKQLMEFKGGARQNAQMSPMAAPLTEQEMRDVAAYYSSQKQTGGAADPAMVELGERIYRAGNPETGVPACSGCHGPAGLGTNLSRFPRISGQHADYTKQTLGYFRAGTRANDPNGMMRGAAGKLTDTEIAALSQYIQGLGE